MVLEAVKVALDPTPAQERLLLSHAGASRFAFNAALAHVKAGIEAGAKPEWSFYSLRKWWNANKDALAVNMDGASWWAENSKEAYSSGLEALAKGLSNWAKSRKGVRKGRRVGFPKFKSKDKAAPRFAYTTGDLNAAINIRVAGSAPETVNAHRETVSRGGQLGRATQVPVKCEPSKRPGAVRLGADERKHVLQTTVK